LFYHSDVETAKAVIQALVAGGARVIEFTTAATRVRGLSRMVVHSARPSAADPGVGSVLDVATAGSTSTWAPISSSAR
jgi:2-keto-3-deoxy-6-phosphogluconate aldolase